MYQYIFHEETRSKSWYPSIVQQVQTKGWYSTCLTCEPNPRAGVLCAVRVNPIQGLVSFVQ